MKTKRRKKITVRKSKSRDWVGAYLKRRSRGPKLLRKRLIPLISSENVELGRGVRKGVMGIHKNLQHWKKNLNISGALKRGEKTKR